jgi:hypothetical protein
MTKFSLAIAVIAAASCASALAQTAAPAASGDPIVALRAEKRAANTAYSQAVIRAHNDRSAKIDAAVAGAVKDADAKGRDPLVAKRDAEARARKATEREYGASLKAAGDERKAALAAADKKLKAAGASGKPAQSAR